MFNYPGSIGNTSIYGKKVVINTELLCCDHQVYWYRQGELDPKFRKLLIYNGVVLILLCLCANLYFLQVGYTGVPTKK